jgi:protein tyrosine phosphatase (PTP) superfamily phosphohydrolase (DUF442 family)
VIVAVLYSCAFTALRWLREFRPVEVVEGRVYRSGQPSDDDLREASATLGLATVVNLRGAQPDQPWYIEELKTTQELGLHRLDLRFQTFDWPAREEVRELVRLLDGAREPVLLHCASGVHRSGWASAVARILAGDPPAEARAELASLPRTLVDGGDGFARRFFERYDRWLAATGRAQGAESFRTWALEVYCPPPYNAEMKILEPPPLDGVAPASRLSFRLVVTNRSDRAWRMSSLPGKGIRLGATMLGPFDRRPPDILSEFRRPGRPGRDLGRAGMEEGTIEPGETRVFDLAFRAPQRPGTYVVHFDMVDELVHWFSDLGTGGLLVDLRVGTGFTADDMRQSFAWASVRRHLRPTRAGEARVGDLRTWTMCRPDSVATLDTDPTSYLVAADTNAVAGGRDRPRNA